MRKKNVFDHALINQMEHMIFDEVLPEYRYEMERIATDLLFKEAHCKFTTEIIAGKLMMDVWDTIGDTLKDYDTYRKCVIGAINVAYM